MIILQIEGDQLSELIQNAVRKVIGESNSRDPVDYDKPLSIKQAAEFLNLSVPCIYALVHRKAIPVSKRGRRLFFKREELLSWLDGGRKLTVNEISLAAKNKIKEIGAENEE